MLFKRVFASVANLSQKSCVLDNSTYIGKELFLNAMIMLCFVLFCFEF